MSDTEPKSRPNFGRRKLLAAGAAIGVLAAGGVAASELAGGMTEEQQKAYEVLWDPNTKTRIYAVDDTEEIREMEGAAIRNNPDTDDSFSKKIGKLSPGKIFKGVPWDGRDPSYPERKAPGVWVAARLKSEADGTEIVGFVATRLLHEIPSK